ncbi:MAG: DNRLRE domain-containing protein [candidate division KSB1 bacterium]|nr:DNRLRE domain-containing protein [candidate division KSB1 bacterium]MDZ7272500.1 DNRLRE domain-containing protein [candidate division KSB1 bacterium]MDZ7284476.1 DNRLRE domain-containing protein [candidate division KSB1 bacterium]MDZ7297128.1 DNRLRE domain-containing protein [candidate division KSB1 bacterium]MDZ7306576.1 DNRLRE domain-containing protein [candidate division KSB1 bacterium]
MSLPLKFKKWLPVALALAAVACTNDSPLAIDSELLLPGQRGQAALQLGPLAAMLDSSAARPIPVATGYVLSANLDEIESRALVRFDSLVAVKNPITKAVLNVTVSRTANDINTTYALMQAHVVRAAWDPATVQWEDMAAGQFDAQPLATSLGSRGATLYAFTLDTSLVNAWRRKAQPNHGFLIEVLPVGVGMEISDFSLQLEAAGTTTAINQKATRTAFVARRIPGAALPPGPVYVGHYVGKNEKYQAALFFNLNAIPKGATISRAVFRAQIDTTVSQFAHGPVNLELFLLAEAQADPLTAPADTLGPSRQFTVTASSRQVESVVTELIQYAINRSGFHGLLVRPLGTLLDRSRVAFYSRETDLSRAPQLLVHYTLPPAGR